MQTDKKCYKQKNMDDKKSKIFGFDKNIFFLGVVSFLTDVSSEMIYPLLPIFLTNILKAPLSFVGLIEGIAESTASILKLFSGAISDKLRIRKPLILFGYGISSLAKPLIAIATAPWHILAIRFMDRTGKGIRTAPRDALIADSCSPNERGKSFGFHRSMDHAGAILGPILASVILYFFTENYRLVFWIAFIPAILSVFFLFYRVTEKVSEVQTKAPFKFSLKPFNKKFKLLLAIIFIFTLSNSSDAFLILRAKDLGISIALIPILWILLHIVKMTSSLPGGILSDKFGRKKILITGWLIYAITYFGFGYAKSALDIWLLFAVYGIFFGLTEGVEKALVADITDSNIRGSAYGMYNFIIGIGAFPSSFIFGIIWQSLGAKTAFFYSSILALASALLLLFTFKTESQS